MATTTSWVTKADLSAYARCPYAFWLVDSGQVPASGAMSGFTLSLVQASAEFERRVLAELAEPSSCPGAVPSEASDGMAVYGLGELENKELGLRGSPSAVRPGAGALVPLEVRSHRRPRGHDRVSLAFDWELLAPWRTRDVEPEGILVLADEGSYRELTVRISPEDLAEARRLVAAVRSARAGGVEPRFCRCHVCSGRPEVMAGARRRRDLALISGLDDAAARALAELGCDSYDALEGLDAGWVAARLKERNLGTSRASVERWQLHARSYAQGRALLVPGHRALPSLARHIALDLEWDLSGQIFLVGAALVEGDKVSCASWWAEQPEAELAALGSLREFLGLYPGLPVLTWNGAKADLPRIEARLAHHGAEGLLSGLAERHFDLLAWSRASLRLPVHSFGLKAVSAALGYPRGSALSAGTDAVAAFGAYRRSGNPALRDRLVAYNRDDVVSLSYVARRLVDLERAGTAAVVPALAG